jgi:hypothetical protein
LERVKTVKKPTSPAKTLDSVIVRIAVLEGMCGAVLALYLANTRNDPTGDLAKALIAALRKDIIEGVAHLPPHMKAEAEVYLDNALGPVTARLPGLHAPGTPSNH